MDRADVIQYIDYPPAEAVYAILRSSLVELMTRGIVEQVDVSDAESAAVAHRLSAVPGTDYLKIEEDQSAVTTLRTMSLGGSADLLNVSRFVGAKLYSLALRCKVRAR